MSRAYERVSTRSTPQSQPILGEDQVENSAGGYVYKVDDWTRLRRFLILGSEGGSYYADEQTLTLDNADVVLRCIGVDGPRAVAEIVEVSTGGLGFKNDPAIFALALASAKGNEETRRAAFAAVSDVCRIGTHLYHFAAYREQFAGWGSGMRKAVARWYARDPQQVAYQAVKYRQRDGWSHRDLLRLAHPKAPSNEHNMLYDWVTHRDDAERPAIRNPMDYAPVEPLKVIAAFEAAQASDTPARTAMLIDEYAGLLPREALRTEHLNAPEVWMALLNQGMPLTAMIRNLASMTRVGVLAPGSAGTQIVLDQLNNEEALRRARVHPIQVLVAMRTYSSGHSFLGRGDSWAPVTPIVDALDAAFYKAFGNVEPMGKRCLFGLDVSGSMGVTLAGLQNISAREGAAAMALVTLATEPNSQVVAFASGGWDTPKPARQRSWAALRSGLVPLAISPRQRLDDVVAATARLPFGGTDCSLPMLYALDNELEVDAFLVYTDSETWAGAEHPVQALRRYRAESGIQDARLVVVSMVPNEFSIADPTDGRMLDVVGFDTSTPNVISAFGRGLV